MSSLLSIAKVEKLPTHRLIAYTKRIRSIDSGFHCGCCGEPYWNIRSYSEEQKKKSKAQYEGLRSYKIAVLKIFHKRKDREDATEQYYKRRGRDVSNKGCQHKIKSKKKLQKSKKYFSKKGQEKDHQNKKAAINSIRKDIKNCNVHDIAMKTGHKIPYSDIIKLMEKAQ